MRGARLPRTPEDTGRAGPSGPRPEGLPALARSTVARAPFTRGPHGPVTRCLRRRPDPMTRSSPLQRLGSALVLAWLAALLAVTAVGASDPADLPTADAPTSTQPSLPWLLVAIVVATTLIPAATWWRRWSAARPRWRPGAPLPPLPGDLTPAFAASLLGRRPMSHCVGATLLDRAARREVIIEADRTPEDTSGYALRLPDRLPLDTVPRTTTEPEEWFATALIRTLRESGGTLRSGDLPQLGVPRDALILGLDRLAMERGLLRRTQRQETLRWYAMGVVAAGAPVLALALLGDWVGVSAMAITGMAVVMTWVVFGSVMSPMTSAGSRQVSALRTHRAALDQAASGVPDVESTIARARSAGVHWADDPDRFLAWMVGVGLGLVGGDLLVRAARHTSRDGIARYRPTGFELAPTLSALEELDWCGLDASTRSIIENRRTGIWMLLPRRWWGFSSDF